MKTEILKIIPDNIDIVKIRYAAQVLKDGGIVAFPTETVYGLGADIFNQFAVDRVFKAKGRPNDNPLIVHIGNFDDLSSIFNNVSDFARMLGSKFWPGPLTLIDKKMPNIPSGITANLDTVAVRLPNNPVALMLINEANVPIAAPSANKSGRPSPTKAEHVIDDLYGSVDIIIDAGVCSVGLESTVVDLSSGFPVVLRPGVISEKEILKVLGITTQQESVVDFDRPKSPGMKYRHYAPNAKLIIFKGKIENVVQKICEKEKYYSENGLKAAIIATDETCSMYRKTENIVSVGSRNDYEGIAARLYDVLRYMDKSGVDIILSESFNEEGTGVAIMNRLIKASGNNVIDV